MKVNTDGILLGAWAKVVSPQNILDVGSGNGLIAIMLAQRFENARVVGVEIDAETLEESKQNAMNSPWSDRLEMILSPIQKFQLTTEESYDLIVSNPPFFSGGTFSYNQERNNVRHTVKLAHNHLIHAVIKLLSAQGEFAVVLPFIEGLRFEQLAERSMLYLTRKCFIRPKPNKNYNRLLLSFSKTEKPFVEEQLCIYQEENKYSKEYKDLTTDFYLAH